MMIRNKNYKAT